MNSERRTSPRAKASVYFNKYIDGRPHLCEAVELSSTGMLLRRIHEPDAERAAYAVEIAAGGERVWLCASPVWSRGDLEALRFVECSERDQAALDGLLARLAA